MSIFNNPARREAKLTRAIKKDPSDSDNYLELGKLYFLDGKYQRAVQVYERGLTIAPKNSSFLFNLAVTKEAQNDIEAAKKIYLAILARDSNYHAAQERLGKLTSF